MAATLIFLFTMSLFSLVTPFSVLPFSTLLLHFDKDCLENWETMNYGQHVWFEDKYKTPEEKAAWVNIGQAPAPAPVFSEDQEESLDHVRQPSLLDYRIRV